MSDEILPSDQKRVKKQAKFTYLLSFRESFWRRNKNGWRTKGVGEGGVIKAIENRVEKQLLDTD